MHSHIQPDPLRCRDVRDRAYEFLDGELAPDTATLVREHLAVCADCLAVVERERAFLRAVRGRPPLAPAPAGLRARVAAALAAEDARRS